MVGKVGVLLGLGALLFAGLASGSSNPKPSPGPSPSPAPRPVPSPVPSTQGLDAPELAQLAANDVRQHGYDSKRGVVRAFQKAFNAQQSSVYGPSESAIGVDDKWGPQTYTAAMHEGAHDLPPAWFQPRPF